MSKITPEEYEQWLAENRPDITVLEPYQGAKKKVRHRCSQEHEWLVRPTNIKAGKGCPKCICEKVGAAKRSHTTESYAEWLAENRPGVQLVGEYKNNRTPTAHICSAGHDWVARPKGVKMGKNCGICAGNAKYTAEQYRDWLADNRPDIRCVGDYVDTKKPVEHQCSEGHVWTTAPCGIKSGRGCPSCRSGSDYNAIYVWEWVIDGEPAGVYKVGVTSWKCGDARIRRCARKAGLDYRIVFLLKTGEQQARAIEQLLLASGHPVDMPDHVVDGRTEFRYFHPDSKAMETIKQLQAIAEGKPIEAQKLTAQQ